MPLKDYGFDQSWLADDDSANQTSTEPDDSEVEPSGDFSGSGSGDFEPSGQESGDYDDYDYVADVTTTTIKGLTIRILRDQVFQGYHFLNF